MHASFIDLTVCYRDVYACVCTYVCALIDAYIYVRMYVCICIYMLYRHEVDAWQARAISLAWACVVKKQDDQWKHCIEKTSFKL